MIQKSPVLTFAAVFSLCLFVCPGFLAAQTRRPKAVGANTKTSAAPRTVLDHYLRLPAKYFPFLEDRDAKNRREILGLVDLKAGYLNFDSNHPSMPVHGEILLLQRASGVPLLVISFTDQDSIVGNTDYLRFVEYAAGQWREVADAAPPLDRKKMAEIYQQKSGKTADAKTQVIYSLSRTDKSITVQMGETLYTDICKLVWDRNVYRLVDSETK